jgi:flavin-binding protein dodecin
MRTSLQPKEELMSEVARVTEISARSPVSFEEAIKSGIERATETLRGVTTAWVKEQKVKVDDGAVVEYQVNLLITFVLE